MKMPVFKILAFLSVVAMLGCGGDKPIEVTPPPPPPAAENAKTVLQEIAQTGQVGSGAMQLRENLEELNQPALLADMDALERMSDPDQIKAKASEMLGKLGGAAAAPSAEETPAEETPAGEPPADETPETETSSEQ
jgi:hypothetical protein